MSAEIRSKGVSTDDDARDKGKREGKALSKLLTDSGVGSYCENAENEEQPENETTVPENDVVPENETTVPENEELPESEEVPQCPTFLRRTEGMPGCSSVDTGTQWQQQLAEEDDYLHHFNLKRFGAPPHVNSLFEALWNAENYTYNRLGRTNTAEDAKRLRWKALTLMQQNLDSYRQFMRDKQADDQVLRHQLHELDTITRPVGYDVFMALTQVMNAVILVTECSRSGNVRTNSYYFGVNRPDKFLHICWISSLGYYDAVVDFGRDSGIDICEKLEEKQMEGFPDLKPSHECDFRVCSLARNWESPYTLGTTGMTVPAKPIGEGIVSDECFLWLRKQEQLLERWKFLLRNLKVREFEIGKISKEASSSDEKVYKGLRFWRQNQHPATYIKLVCGLREDSLERIAATIEDRFMKDPVENDDGDSDGSFKDHVQLTSKEDHATLDSEA